MPCSAGGATGLKDSHAGPPVSRTLTPRMLLTAAQISRSSVSAPSRPGQRRSDGRARSERPNSLVPATRKHDSQRTCRSNPARARKFDLALGGAVTNGGVAEQATDAGADLGDFLRRVDGAIVDIDPLGDAALVHGAAKCGEQGRGVFVEEGLGVAAQAAGIVDESDKLGLLLGVERGPLPCSLAAGPS